MKARYLGGGIGLASAVLLIALGSASADQWFVLGEKAIKSMDPSTEIKGRRGEDVEGGHQEGEDLGRGR